MIALENTFNGIERLYKKHSIEVLAMIALMFFVFSFVCFIYGVPTLQEIQENKIETALSGFVTLSVCGIFALSLITLKNKVKEQKNIQDHNDDMIIMSHLLMPFIGLASILFGMFVMFQDLSHLKNHNYNIYKMVKMAQRMNQKAFKQKPMEMRVILAIILTVMTLAAYIVKVPTIALNALLLFIIYLLYSANKKMQIA